MRTEIRACTQLARNTIQNARKIYKNKIKGV